MNITEARAVVTLLRHLDGSEPNANSAYAKALYLKSRASTALRTEIGVNGQELADSLVEVER